MPPTPGSPHHLALALSPAGGFFLASDFEAPALPEAAASALREAFACDPALGLLHLGSEQVPTQLSPSLRFGRSVGLLVYDALRRAGEVPIGEFSPALPAPEVRLAALVASAPPMRGGEYLSPAVMAATWRGLTGALARELEGREGCLSSYLHEKQPSARALGKVCLHLAENKRDPRAPFAFLATYSTRLSDDGRVKHLPLGRALQQHSEAGQREALLRLLRPLQDASRESALLREMLDSGAIYHAQPWSAEQAYRFLAEIPGYEESGLVVRVPDWWKARSRQRPRVSVTVGQAPPAELGLGAMLDFEMSITLGGAPLSDAERAELLSGTAGLRLIKGEWVEVDPERLRELLVRWEQAHAHAREGGHTFVEAMRLLAGSAAFDRMAEDDDGDAEASWGEVSAGPWLEATLGALRAPAEGQAIPLGDALRGTLRPYQRDGLRWMWLIAQLGLGACLADDMGLGKTIQVLALLLALERDRAEGRSPASPRGPHLLVVPTSLLGNWQTEAARFAPSLKLWIAHASATPRDVLRAPSEEAIDAADLVITTYGTLPRLDWVAARRWGLVILDEAQAIKSPGAKQTRAIKKLHSHARIALTGTPVENRLGDLWSLFDFLCPGLLGSARAFGKQCQTMAERGGYAPLRRLLAPYLLRRLKTDPAIAGDLPEKTEVVRHCGLSKVQATLYQQAVDELRGRLDAGGEIDGMARRGLVLAWLTRFKQICNHPSQWLGDGAWQAEGSGKVAVLRELAEPIAARQEKLLVFTQFREMVEPLHDWLAEIFGRPGVVLHGGTPARARSERVEAFQRAEGPPFFVLSLKAGGTGLNLTAASHVLHFDRWWNPAIEAQATDRAYRIGQRRNVLVHKFVCIGTIEERIDAIIEKKRALSEQLLAKDEERWITELDADELLAVVSLDLERALQR